MAKAEKEEIISQDGTQPESQSQPQPQPEAQNGTPLNKVPKKKIPKLTIGIVAAVPVIIAVTVYVTLMLIGKPEEPIIEPVGMGNLIMTEENYLEIGAAITEKVEKGMFETHMNTTWTFPDGKSPSSDAVMGNAGSNNYAFYFTVNLSSTGETVFTSGLLPVGTQMAEIILDKELEQGTYNAVVQINLVEEDMTPIESNMGFNITLEVES